MVNILDPKFKYISAAKTDIRKTFARIRKEQADAVKREREAELERIQKVKPMMRSAR